MFIFMHTHAHENDRCIIQLNYWTSKSCQFSTQKKLEKTAMKLKKIQNKYIGTFIILSLKFKTYSIQGSSNVNSFETMGQELT